MATLHHRAPPAHLVSLWATFIVAGAALAYANSFHGPFVFDDVVSIPHNTSLHHFATAFFPPHGSGTTVEARPILNLSLALNYFISGDAVWSYHLLNLLIHVAAALLLFGLVRRTLARGNLGLRLAVGAAPIAGVIALWWTVHPLQTESVTYLIQRAESLTGLFFLGSVYGLARSADSSRPARWLGLSVGAVVLGLLTKELMVAALPLLYLYDTLFALPTEGYLAPWRRHRGYYLGLLSSVLVLAAVLADSGGNRSGSIGLGTGVDIRAYWATQVPAVLTYLKLSLFPDPLVFEHGTFWVTSSVGLIPGVLLIAALIGATGYGLVRRSPWAFLGAWFLVILAPTSLVPGTTQMIVEHRMYLPLAAVLAVVVLLAARLIPSALPLAGVVVAILLGLATSFRNHAYRSELALWIDTVAKLPDNARAQNNLGLALEHRDDLAGAINHFREALKLDPALAEAQNNLAVALVHEGRLADALPYCEEAIRSRPNAAELHANYGVALVRLGRGADAVREFSTAARLDPTSAWARSGLGVALASLGRYAEAAATDAQAVRLDPANAQAHSNLGNALAHLGRGEDAITQYRLSLSLQPADAQAQNNLGVALAAAGRLAEAIPAYQEAIRLDPLLAEAHNNLGTALAQSGRLAEAYPEFATAVRLAPGFSAAVANLAAARRQLGLAP